MIDKKQLLTGLAGTAIGAAIGSLLSAAYFIAVTSVQEREANDAYSDAFTRAQERISKIDTEYGKISKNAESSQKMLEESNEAFRQINRVLENVNVEFDLMKKRDEWRQDLKAADIANALREDESFRKEFQALIANSAGLQEMKFNLNLRTGSASDDVPRTHVTTDQVDIELGAVPGKVACVWYSWTKGLDSINQYTLVSPRLDNGKLILSLAAKKDPANSVAEITVYVLFRPNQN